MDRTTAIVLTTFAIGYFTAIIFATGAVNFELPINANGEVQKGIDHIVELKDGIVLQSSLTTDHHIPHPSVGTIQVSEDGSTCWVTTEKIGVLYYKITECPENA
jgi:hypothetical protein